MIFILLFTGLIGSAISFLWVSLWQVEIADRWATDKTGYDSPFYLKSKVNRSWARDFWYLINALGFALAFASGIVLGLMF